jgi:3-oxoadipate enol-lactonase
MTAQSLVARDGQHLAWDATGPAGRDTVVLLHALGTDRTLWDELTPRLAATHHVVRVDLRGHGASTPVSGAPSIAALAGDVVAVLDKLGADRAHVAGVSLGGLVAQWLGIHAPARVRSLTLANTAARIGSLDVWNARIAAVHAGGLAAIADAAPARWFSEAFRASRPDRVDVCRSRLLAMPVDGYLHGCAVLRDTDLSDAVPHITTPTVVIGGHVDVATPPADSEWLASAIPGATLRMLDAAHLSNVECPDAFYAAMCAFIEPEVRHG